MIFVTGATGFLGSKLCELLIEKGYSIKASKRENSIIPEKLKRFKQEIEWVDIDLLDFEAVYDALSNCNAIFHCAATVSFNPKMKQTLWANNVHITANLVNVALEIKDIYFMHVSSIAAIGNAKNNDLIDENCRWIYTKNSSDYSVTKFEAEREVWRGMTEGLQACIVNPSIILGYDASGRGSMKMVQMIKSGLKYYTSGTVGFVDVQDVANCMIILFEKKINNGRFILNSENLTYKEIFEIIARSLNLKAPTISIGKRMLFLLAYILKFLSFFTGKSPKISLSTTNTAYKKLTYSNKKITDTIDYKFMPITKSIEIIVSQL
ncbi:MAG: NAD-dependent epimerase/dehydratase family protein [bacterium]|jgi:dihydroflavonol-4-reductase